MENSNHKVVSNSLYIKSNAETDGLINISPINIQNSFQELLTELNDKVYVYTAYYWRYIYIDRFCKIILLASSVTSAMILSFNIASFTEVSVQHTFFINLCIIYGFNLLTLLLCVTLLFFKIRSKCVYYSGISKLYGNVLAELKKIVSDPMNQLKCEHEYERIIKQLTTIDQFEMMYKII